MLDTERGSAKTAAEFEINARSGAPVKAISPILDGVDGIEFTALPDDRIGAKRMRATIKSANWPRAVSVIKVRFKVWRANDAEPTIVPLSVVVRGKNGRGKRWLAKTSRS
jgi:hypothetical protein